MRHFPSILWGEIRRAGRPFAKLRKRAAGVFEPIAEQTRQTTADLRSENARLKTAIDTMSQGLIVIDGGGGLVFCNPRYVRMYRLPPDGIRRCRDLRDILELRRASGTFRGDPEQTFRSVMSAAREGKSVKYVTKLDDGRSIKITNEPIAGGGWVSTHSDMTERALVEDELRRTQEFLDTIIENVPIPIVVKAVKDRRYTLVNRAAEMFFGKCKEQMIGKLTHDVYPQKRADIIEARDDEALRPISPILFSEHSIPGPDGNIRDVRSTKALVGDDDDTQLLISLIEDVTAKSEGERRIEYMAHHDSLTDLPNRAFFNQCLESTIERANATGARFAVLFLDLDGFKAINDVYGHSIGDALLRELALRVNILAEGAFVARLGGDEFTLIVADDPEQSSSSALCKRLLQSVAADFEINDCRLRIAISVGVAAYPTDGLDAKTLMNNADAALYRAKAEGRGTVRFFDPTMAQRLREQHALREDLRIAIEHGDLVLQYQPQARMNGETVGFEALVRWRCAKRGWVMPGEFIPIAEESGLIVALGEWVLRESCREAASWPLPLQISVNVSPVQFRSGDLLAVVHAVLLETGLSASRLQLEITEGVLIDDFSRASSLLGRLKALGVRIALDDFGTGYSSLSYLHSFPFDKIKIDRAFISGVQQNRHSAAIVRAVVGLGRSLDIPILAEGVETEAERRYLQGEGCDEMQGYLLGRPHHIAEYAERIGRPRESVGSAALTAS